MRLTTRHDIAMPAAAVFDALADTSLWERLALRRGVDVRRADAAATGGIGAAWDCRFPLRGRMRRLSLRLVLLEHPTRIDFAGAGRSYDLTASAEVIALSPQVSRVVTRVDLRPSTLASRMALQAARLAKASIERRQQARVAALLDGIRTRHHGAS